MTINSKEAYFKGLEYLSKKDYINAKYYFNLALDSSVPKIYDSALTRLITIAMRQGNYVEARRLLNENHFFNITRQLGLVGMLEAHEINIMTSRAYYNQCLNYPSSQYDGIVGLADTYVQTADNEIAKKMLETIGNEDILAYKTKIVLVSLLIREGNYAEAYKLLQTLKMLELRNAKTKKTNKLLDKLTAIVEMKLGISTDINARMNSERYEIRRLFVQDDKDLINHLRSHSYQEIRKGYSCFLRNTDFKSLLTEVREIIQDKNPIYVQTADNYKIKLGKEIGYCSGEITTDLSVITTFGTKDIITMYPIQLSEQFDSEGFSTDTQIAIKRKQRRINND